MCFGSNTKFVIRIQQNHTISSMDIYMQFDSSTQFVIRTQQNHIILSIDIYMHFGSSTQFVIRIKQNHTISSNMNIHMHFITQYILSSPSAMVGPLPSFFIEFIHFTLLSLPDAMVVWTENRFGRWLRRHRLREWWPELAMGGRRKRFAEEREKPEEEERVTVAAWWSVGGCVGFL